MGGVEMTRESPSVGISVMSLMYEGNDGVVVCAYS